MANRYCITTGNFNSTATWSATEHGHPGASVPVVGDDIYVAYVGLVMVQNWASPTSHARNIFVMKNADFGAEAVSGGWGEAIGIAAGKTIDVQGRLTLYSPGGGSAFVVLGGGALRIGSGGVIDCKQTGTYIEASASFVNEGRFFARERACYFQPAANGSILFPGTINLVTLDTGSGGALKTRFEGPIDFGSFGITLWGTGETENSLTVEFGSGHCRLGEVRTPTLRFSTALVFKNDGPLFVTGDIGTTAYEYVKSFTWLPSDTGIRTFEGTADQVIAFPAGANANAWFVDKPAGTLDLASFIGNLQGRVRNLIVRGPAKIDLAGTPPLLQASDQGWNEFNGLKADATPASQQPGVFTVADHLREAMDSCENYGEIVIPRGKTLCTKSFKNHVGARVSGNGTLCVRYGGLSDSGTIAAATTVRYFDCPIRAVLSAAETAWSNRPYSVDVTGSLGTRFRLDWGDGTFSETESAGTLDHVYATANGDRPATLVLTVVNEDGTVATATRNILVAVPEISIALELTPEAGVIPLEVAATVESAEGVLFTFDWGNGNTTGPQETPVARYTYTTPGHYTITATAQNIEGGSLSASRGITVLPKPAVRLDLAPELGVMPLTVVVSAEATRGNFYTFDWGNGQTTGPLASGDARYTYLEAGYYTVTVHAETFDGETLSTSCPVTVLPLPSIDLTVVPSLGYRPLTVLAVVESTRTGLYTFDWGNGQTTGPLGVPQASHDYPDEGNYTVSVTVVTPEGETLSTSRPVTVLATPPLPRARLAVTPWQGNIPLSVTVSTEGTEADRVRIDWGDGTPLMEPASSVHGLTHTYEEAGRYLVKLRAWNPNGDWVEASQVVSTLDPDEVRAALVLQPSSGIAPLTVLADASDSNGSTFSFTWSDGNSTGPLTESRTTHTFERPGYYPVIVTVTKDGLTASASAGAVVLLSPLIPTDPILPSPLGPVEIDGPGESHGVPRGNLPFPYRYTLAQGVCFMPDTLQLFCPMTESGRALENGSALFLGRITHADTRPVSPTEIESARYTIFRLDDSDASVRVPVEGHAEVDLAVDEILAEDVVLDENWPFDEIGYNFRYCLDDIAAPPFPVAGRNYLVAFTLIPLGRGPKIQVQYRVRVV